MDTASVVGVKWWHLKQKTNTIHTVVAHPTIFVAQSILFQKSIDANVATNVEQQLPMEPSSGVAADVARPLLILVQSLNNVGAWWNAGLGIGKLVVEFHG